MYCLVESMLGESMAQVGAGDIGACVPLPVRSPDAGKDKITE